VYCDNFFSVFIPWFSNALLAGATNVERKFSFGFEVLVDLMDVFASHRLVVNSVCRLSVVRRYLVVTLSGMKKSLWIYLNSRLNKNIKIMFIPSCFTIRPFSTSFIKR
jgi:hypothetical protein